MLEECYAVVGDGAETAALVDGGVDRRTCRYAEWREAERSS